MKRVCCAIFAFCLLVSCTGCGGRQAVETDMIPAEIAETIRQRQTDLPEFIQITPLDADFATWLSDYYYLQTEQVADGVICYADGVEASEIAVLLMTDEKDCGTAEEALQEYIRNRVKVFEGYAPQQAAMVKDGIVAVNGRYVALLICQEPQLAESTFLNCFGKGVGSRDGSGSESTGGTDAEAVSSMGADGRKSVPAMETEDDRSTSMAEPTGEIDFYDADAILQAYRSGDDSTLSEQNRAILKAAAEVIESEVDDSMNDYEKELAIHDYITGWSRFDYSVFGRSAQDGFADGSDTPYGVLIGQSAMCHGYSSTFQLFMDMLDIECMTVYGLPGGNGVEHSWNMVKLEEEWYCVDCAWDDPIGGSPCHTYFNVTSDYLRRGSIHRWEETLVPEAVGTKYAYDGR